MIRRSYRIAVFGMLGLAVGGAEGLEAQRHARVQVDWQWRDAGHRARFDHALRTAWLPRVGAPDPGFLYRPVAGVKIPPGHRPARGLCRLWYPGVAPGHQPGPVRCHALRGVYRPGVLIVTWQGPLRPLWDGYTGVYWRGYRDVVVARGPGAPAYGGSGPWWDDPMGRRAAPRPRVRVPAVAHRSQEGGRGRWEEGRPGRGGGSSGRGR